MKKLDLKHKIPKQGKYNEYISECLECNYTPNQSNDDSHIFHAVGWFQLNGEWCMVWECPKCFAKWYHHDRELDFYYAWLRYNNI
jgi:hypothetical protein